MYSNRLAGRGKEIKINALARFILSPLLLLIIMAVPGIALSQTDSAATIRGTVTESTGAVVSRAMVELLNTATKKPRRQTTDETGQYSFPSGP